MKLTGLALKMIKKSEQKELIRLETGYYKLDRKSIIF